MLQKPMKYFREYVGLPTLLCCLITLSACAAQDLAQHPQSSSDNSHSDIVRFVNRISWGINSSTMNRTAFSYHQYLEQQLHPDSRAPLPPEIQSQIASMTISQRSMEEIISAFDEQRKAFDAMNDDEKKQEARKAYQQELNRLGREAAARFILRALYSPNQLQEQMTWFWMNHFNVHQHKHNIRAMIGDYEEHAIRPNALGNFRDLLRATVYHPAMLRYLDNERNASGRINENYARELMELHTLGVDGGYTQQDVQELARILTGVGVNAGPDMPNVRRQLQSQYVRRGLFEFNPNRHDYGNKTFLNAPIRSSGLGEVDEALDRLSHHPATARFICRKLAVYFVSDEPSNALVEHMARTFINSDGDIKSVLRVLFTSNEFMQSLGRKFKDPIHYVISSVRLAYDDKPILNAGPIINWLNRMGEPLYGRQTPDGYPVIQSAWNGPGQMAVRFEIARAIGSGSAGLFRAEGAQIIERPAFPQLANALYYQSLEKTLSAGTKQALGQANTPQEWNLFFLSSPEMMNR